MKPSDILNRPEKWTTGEFARNLAGFSVDPCDSAACSFCILGAIYAAYGKGSETDAARRKINEQIISKYGNIMDFKTKLYMSVIAQFNDDPRISWDKVVEILKAAGE